MLFDLVSPGELGVRGFLWAAGGSYRLSGPCFSWSERGTEWKLDAHRYALPRSCAVFIYGFGLRDNTFRHAYYDKSQPLFCTGFSTRFLFFDSMTNPWPSLSVIPALLSSVKIKALYNLLSVVRPQDAGCEKREQASTF